MELMCCEPMGFIPEPLKRPLPPGYELDGMTGLDGCKTVTVYHWTQKVDESNSATWRFGPNVPNRFTAWQQAWRDYRSGGTDEAAVEKRRW
jgi:hypothetical protein